MTKKHKTDKSEEILCEYTKLVDPGGLKPNPKNPNRHPPKQLKMLEANIRKCGWRHPVVISKLSGYIVAGHAQCLVAQNMGCKIPIDEQAFSSPEEELVMLLADNDIG